jgi:hypothetical protein
MYLINCDFKFFNIILAKFSGDPWVMGHIGHGSACMSDPFVSSGLIFTALAREERGNVIARVFMSVRMFVCMCVTKCATNINSPRRCGTMGFYFAASHLAKHHVIGIVLDITMVAMIAICWVVTLVEAMNWSRISLRAPNLVRRWQILCW